MLEARSVRFGGLEVRNNLTARAGDSADCSVVHMYRDSSEEPSLHQRCRLKPVLDVMQVFVLQGSLFLVG